jgi:DNA-binding transcriptional LysR family regulator
MDVRQLKYFIAVAEENNIGRAAARLHISQPPLTRQIQALEAELGVLLFTRTNWGVKLTQAGERLLEHARNIKTHVELAKEDAQRAGKGQVGRIDVGIFGSAMLNIIPQILNSFVESYPEVKVVLHTLNKGRQIEALHQGRILIAFERYLPESPGLDIELVSREPLRVAFNQRNPLAAQPFIAIDELRDEPIIGEVIASAAVKTLFEQHELEPRVVQKAADMISAVVMVAGGFGTAIVPDSLQSLQLPNVVYRPLLTDVEVLIDLHCAYRKDERSPLLKALLQTVRDYRRKNRETVELATPKRSGRAAAAQRKLAVVKP